MAGPNNACFPKSHPSPVIYTELIPDNNRTEIIFNDVVDNSRTLGLAVALYRNQQCEFVEVKLPCNNFSGVGDTYVCKTGNETGPDAISPFISANTDVSIESPVTFDNFGPGILVKVKERFLQTYNPMPVRLYFLSNEYIRTEVARFIADQASRHIDNYKLDPPESASISSAKKL